MLLRVIVASNIQGELFLFTCRFLYIVQVSLEGIVLKGVSREEAYYQEKENHCLRKVLLSLCILRIPWYEVSCFYSQLDLMYCCVRKILLCFLID